MSRCSIAPLQIGQWVKVKVRYMINPLIGQVAHVENGDYIFVYLNNSVGSQWIKRNRLTKITEAQALALMI